MLRMEGVFLPLMFTLVWELFSMNFWWLPATASAGKDAEVMPESGENCIKGYNQVPSMRKK